MQFQGIVGMVFLVFMAYLLSEHRRQIPWRYVLSALLLQMVLAALFLHIPLFQSALQIINKAALALQSASEAGSAMVFG